MMCGVKMLKVNVRQMEEPMSKYHCTEKSL